MAFNCEDLSTKMGSKGVPHSVKLELNNFRDKLYGDVSKSVELRSLRLINNRMVRTTQRRNALNDFFTKFRLLNDRITCQPLQINGQYI